VLTATQMKSPEASAVELKDAKLPFSWCISGVMPEVGRAECEDVRLAMQARLAGKRGRCSRVDRVVTPHDRGACDLASRDQATPTRRSFPCLAGYVSGVTLARGLNFAVWQRLYCLDRDHS
jgi:hypothetical protein